MIQYSKHMTLPHFKYEMELWSKGIQFVAGCDEVGRGCFAGPVVTAAVVFLPQITNSKLQITNYIKINDSKQLNEKQRVIADKWIRENAISYGIGEASVSEINKFGIVPATNKAFRRAIATANKILRYKDIKIKSEKLDKSKLNIPISQYPNISFLLTDAFYIPRVLGLSKDKQLPIIKGDQKSMSIAAASIIAKVYRDKLMTSLGNRYKFKRYLWNQNKGYGTRKHREAIMQYGITSFHRTKFVETFFSKTNYSLLTT